MSTTTAVPVTRLLSDWRQGDAAAFDRMSPAVYNPLKRMAAARLRDEHCTLQPTALVHEVYLRLAGSPQPAWESRGHFFGIAGYVMRQILMQRARARDAAKRGNGCAKVSLEDAGALAAPSLEATEMADALAALALEHPRKSAILEMCYFGGFTTEEVSARLDVSLSTVEREKRFALAWLRRRLEN